MIEQLRPAAAGVPAIATTVTAPDGTDYQLGRLALTTSVLEIKQQLARVTPMSVGAQTLFHMEDGRGEDADLRLGNGEVLGEVRRYGSGWKEEEEEAEAEPTGLEVSSAMPRP